MPALAKTRYTAEIVWLGRVLDRRGALQSAPVDRLDLRFKGPEGEDHGGLTRPACSRVRGLYPAQTPIRNTRQLSILSQEELEEIARRMKLDTLDPALVGASMVIRGIPDFTHVTPCSRLLAASGASLTIEHENRPCTLPARPIETAHTGFGAKFKPAAKGLRGVTAWIEAEGQMALGDRLELFVPDQPAWAVAADAVLR